MEKDFSNVIERADRDAVNLKDNANLRNAAEGVQRLFDESSNLGYGRKAFLLNSYVNEVNHHADDIYGQGKHIKLEIVDSNNNDRLDPNDRIKATRSNRESDSIPLSQYNGVRLNKIVMTKVSKQNHNRS
jgi:hypothetical protein